MTIRIFYLSEGTGSIQMEVEDRVHKQGDIMVEEYIFQQLYTTEVKDDRVIQELGKVSLEVGDGKVVLSITVVTGCTTVQLTREQTGVK